jgi:Ca-activated chloride channel homolog
MTFDHPWLLIAAPFLAAAVGGLALLARRRRVAAAEAWSAALGQQARMLGHRTPLVLAGAALLAGAGMAGPRWGQTSRALESRARNVVLVVDVSRSMLAQDASPDRLQYAVGLARRLLSDLSGDRIGLVAYAGGGYLLAPLTLDATAISVQLDALDPDMASEGGSALADALGVSRNVLAAAHQGGDKAIVVFTDGESFEGNAALQDAGREVLRAGITLVMVPVGSLTGARIPEPGGGWHKDAAGQDVVTVRRDDLVQLVAAAAHGVVIPPATRDPVSAVQQALARLQGAPASDRTGSRPTPRAWLFALAAALLLLAHTVTRRSAALAALLLTIGLGRLSAQRPSPGTRLLTHGDTASAAGAFLHDARESGSDTAWFNAGTSALVRGDLSAAIDALQRATLSVDPALRHRALYNLGTTYLVKARRDTARRDTLLDAAARQLQQALLLDPGDRNAKYNYELALRLKPPASPSSAPRPQRGGGGGETPPPPHGAMTQAEAEQVLSAMERAEQQTRRSMYQRQSHAAPRRGPDW